MKKNLNYFNYEERNGIFLLAFLLVLFCLFIFLQKRVLPEKTSITLIHSSIPIQVTADFTQSSEKNQTNRKSEVETIGLEKQRIEKFPTNNRTKYSISKPNSTSPPESKSIKKKVFKSMKQTKFFKKKKKGVKGFSINSKNPEDWKQIYGIGEGYASRIIKYQNWLGGFHSKSQIKEVYGITDSFYNEFETHLLPSKPYRMMDINTVEEKALGSHPYISWKDAKKIIRFRKHHYPIQNKEEFYSILGVHDTIKAKLVPYLVFSPKIELPIETATYKVSSKGNKPYIPGDSLTIQAITDKIK